MSDWAKVLAFGCVHHGVTDKDTLKWRLDHIKTYNPDYVVNLGDWLDADGASRWPNEHTWTLKDEYRAAAEDAKAIREAAPNAKLVWLMGNHDDNLEAPNRIPVKLREACSWREDKDLSAALTEGGWTILPYNHRSLYRIGQVTFQHGAQTNVNSDRDQSLLYGVQFGLWVGAHTHRPTQITQVVLPGKVSMKWWYSNVGCGADWTKMEYVNRSNISTWGHGVMKLRVNDKQKRAWFGSQQWEPDPGLVIHKMAH